MIKMDKSKKIIITGFAVIGLLAVIGTIFSSLFMVLLRLDRPLNEIRAIEKNSPDEKDKPKSITYSFPILTPYSDFAIFPISITNAPASRGEVLSDIYSATSDSKSSPIYRSSGNFNNMLFYNKKNGKSHLLLKKKAMINTFYFPYEKEEIINNQVPKFLLFNISETDTNTDGVINATTFEEILDSLNSDAYLSNWISSDEVDQFQKYATKWQSQFDIDSTRRYIDDFLYMIAKVETENPGHRVKVIVCLDIMSSSATECADMVKYIRDNDIWDCEVAYVEIGNEMYFNFAEDMLGIYNFDDYWNYINGGYPDNLNQYVVGDSVWFDHDYIAAFKSDPAFQNKLAVPARNLGAGYAFFTPDYVGLIGGAESWNDTLATHYLDSIEIGTSGIYTKKFDGVVLHP